MKKILFFALTLFCLTGFSNRLKAQDLRVYEYYNSTLQRHFYTTNFNELGNGAQGFTLIKTIGSLSSSGNPSNVTGTASRAVYRFYNSSTGAHYYTMRGTVYPSGFHLESIMGYTPPVILLNPIPVYEYYDPTNHDYYYATTNGTVSSYTLNGIAYYVAQ
ncbi:MAG: hypothetical protein ACHQHN_02600 [Sphingobacteriales bacterium]